MYRKMTSIGLVSLLVLSVIMIAAPVSAGNPAQAIWVEPSPISLQPGNDFTVNVKVNISSPTLPGGGTGLFGFEYKLRWDSTVLDVVKIVTHADNVPAGDLPAGWTAVLVAANNTAVPGRHWYAVSALLGTAFTGVYSLCAYTFHVKAVGSCALDIYEEKLVDDKAKLITHTTTDGYFGNLPTANLYVHPPKIVNPDLVPCENFTININVLNAVNLYSWEFKLYYNSSILNGTSVAEGPFLNTSGPTNFVIKEFNDSFNATHGLVWVNCTLLAPPPVSGNGTLAVISFHVEALGESVLDLMDTALRDPWNMPVPHSTSDGYFNNVLKAHLYVDPPSIIDPTLLPPSQFNITIKVGNVTDLYDYQFKLGYDTAVLNCLGVIIFPFENETNFIMQIEVDDAAGFVWVNVTYYPPAEPLTTKEPVALAMIFFQVQAMGYTVLDLYDTRLSDPLDGDIPHDVSDGLIMIVERDVAVIAVVPFTNNTYGGRIVRINVTVANEGDLIESFNVSTYYDDTLIQTLPVIGLAPNATRTITFTWNTTGVAPCHNYTIKAEASAVPYERDLADNIYVDGKVKIRMLGDINGDRVIDIVDFVLAALAFGSAAVDDPETPWDETANWNPEADLNLDGIVDIVDLVMIGIDFGKTC